MSNITIRLPDSLHKQLRDLARREGISINQFVSSAVAEKMSALLSEEYLDERARRGSREAFDRAPSQVLDRVPGERDRI